MTSNWSNARLSLPIIVLCLVFFTLCARHSSAGQAGESPPSAEAPAVTATAEQPNGSTNGPTNGPTGGTSGEAHRDPLAGLLRSATENPPTEAGFRAGACWLAAFWLGILTGWLWRRGEMFPFLLGYAGLVVLLHLFSGIWQTVAGLPVVVYGGILARIGVFIGGRTGRYLLIWVGIIAGPTIFAESSTHSAEITLIGRVVLPAVVHFILCLMLGWPILAAGGLKRVLAGGPKALLNPVSRRDEQTVPQETGAAGGCFGSIGFLACFMAAINVLGLLIGETPIRSMLAAPNISFEELRKSPLALKYARVKGCPAAIPEASFDLSDRDESGGKADGRNPVLSKLLIPMSGLVQGKPASSTLLLISTRRRWRQLFLRARSPTVDLASGSLRFQPRDLTRYDRFIEERAGEFYPVEDLLVEVAASPTAAWSSAPIAIPGDSGNELYDRPRPMGLSEPYVEVIDRGPAVSDAIIGWAMSVCFIGGWLIWWKEP